MHECPFCGEACDCDGEDVWHGADSPAVESCDHECADLGEDDDLDVVTLDDGVRCRVCHCTNAQGCVTSEAGSRGCVWVEDDLCSRCATQELVRGFRNQEYEA